MSQPTRIPPRRKSKGDGQVMFSALLVVIVMASLVGMYFYIEEQKNNNGNALTEISDKIEVIEGKLSITNEDSEQNMETMTDQIAFLDKEVRKLWGHRKGYLDKFKAQENKSIQNEKSIKNLKAISTGLEDQLTAINQKIQLAEDLQLKITLVTNELNKQKQVIEDNQASIDAVDSYRRQNNQKVADVLNRLNGLTRDLQAIEKELKDLKEESESEQSTE
jgi:chromosome segregation ATPase|tara:strand:+ start:2048 stop:2707 length:660 start_codon:yes stop_codon:yes gene_type:complete